MRSNCFGFGVENRFFYSVIKLSTEITLKTGLLTGNILIQKRIYVVKDDVKLC